MCFVPGIRSLCLERTGWGGKMRATAALFGLFCTIISSSQAIAARIDVTPSITLDQIYDSNVFNSGGRSLNAEQGDFLLRAVPELTLSLRMPETTLNLRSGIASEKYYKFDQLNNVTSSITLALDSTTPIRVSPALAITPAAHFVQTRDSFHRNQLLPVGDPQAPANFSSESTVVKSRDYGGALHTSYLATSNLTATVGGGVVKRDYLENVPGIFGFRVLSADADITYRYTPRFSTGLFALTDFDTFESQRSSRTYGGGLTMSYQIFQGMMLSARGGASHTRETDPVLPDIKNWSPNGMISIAYTHMDFRGTLTGSMDKSGTGSFAFTTRRRTIVLSLTDQFARGWWWDLGGSYQRNQSIDDAKSVDLATVTASAGVRYRVREWAMLHLTGTGFRQWSSGPVGTDMKRDAALLGFSIGNTYNLY